MCSACALKTHVSKFVHCIRLDSLVFLLQLLLYLVYAFCNVLGLQTKEGNTDWYMLICTTKLGVRWTILHQDGLFIFESESAFWTLKNLSAFRSEHHDPTTLIAFSVRNSFIKKKIILIQQQLNVYFLPNKEGEGDYWEAKGHKCEIFHITERCCVCRHCSFSMREGALVLLLWKFLLSIFSFKTTFFFLVISICMLAIIGNKSKRTGTNLYKSNACTQEIAGCKFQVTFLYFHPAKLLQIIPSPSCNKSRDHLKQVSMVELYQATYVTL